MNHTKDFCWINRVVKRLHLTKKKLKNDLAAIIRRIGHYESLRNFSLSSSSEDFEESNFESFFTTSLI